MTGLKAILGLPVVVDGRQVGRVEAGYLTESGEELLGLVIRNGMRGARWLDAGQIVSLGGVCVLAAGCPQRLPKQLAPMPGPVWDPCGLRLGRVTDVYLRGLRVEALEIFLGPWDDRRFGRMVARVWTLVPEGRVMKVLAPLDALARKEEFCGDH